jgi:TPR repeat protein
MYERGEGVTRDLAEARRLYEKAAAAGDDEAAKHVQRLRRASGAK